jgi:hypothetical protein
MFLLSTSPSSYVSLLCNAQEFSFHLGNREKQIYSIFADAEYPVLFKEKNI